MRRLLVFTDAGCKIYLISDILYLFLLSFNGVINVISGFESIIASFFFPLWECNCQTLLCLNIIVNTDVCHEEQNEV